MVQFLYTGPFISIKIGSNQTLVEPQLNIPSDSATTVQSSAKFKNNAKEFIQIQSKT
jgi:hypothetical protein